MVVMYLLFAFVNFVGGIPQGWIEDGFAALQAYAVQTIPEGQLQSLVSDGIIAGVGAVLSFLPLILLLFLGISFLEDTGYMARAAFVIDRVMRACGLHGILYSFIIRLWLFRTIRNGCPYPRQLQGSNGYDFDYTIHELFCTFASVYLICKCVLPKWLG